MSLLDNLPHRCTIRVRSRSKGTLGGPVDSFTNVSTNVRCWEQRIGTSESEVYQKRGMDVSHKIYFASDPSVTENHQILITERNGTTVSSPVALDVVGVDFPDASKLVASSRELEEIRALLKVDSLAYLSMEGMLRCVDEPAHFCTACFTGEYPV